METKPAMKQLGSSSMRTVSLVACLLVFPLIIMMSVSYHDQMFDLIGGLANIQALRGKPQNSSEFGTDTKPNSYQPAAGISDDDVLVGGLLPSGFDQESCLSRYQSVQYRKPFSEQLSAYLLSKLRNYETLHKKCGPGTEAYKATLKVLYSRNISGPTECNYIVWIAESGLGNRVLSMTATFLYAILSNRVLLVEHNSDMADLFCEPFPNTTWLLPKDFPHEFRWNNSRPTFGKLLKSNVINATMDFPPSFLHFSIFSHPDFYEKFFYCDEYHTSLLPKVPWLILKSDKYIVPSLFLMPSFQEELHRMFPDKESVFHILSRYLIHPANKAWGIITRFYQSYLADANERVGIQVRVFSPRKVSFQRLMDQIIACTLKENLMPPVDKQKLIASPPKNMTSKAVLIASLYSNFYDNLTNMYLTYPTTSGDIITVFQPSHENRERYGDNKLNMKAWVEMNLLSMSNVLVTSSYSTFGYVSMGLGRLRPWILYRPEYWNPSAPACFRALSMEPCLHEPPNYDCKTKAGVDMGKVVPYVKHCDDSPNDLKLFNSRD